jgi:hypothetical protein
VVEGNPNKEGESDFNNAIDSNKDMADKNIYLDFIDFNVSPFIYI